MNVSFCVTNISVTVSGSSASVCVETEGAATDKSLGMPQNSASYIRIIPGGSNFVLVRPT